jgi:hypothetical protein
MSHTIISRNPSSSSSSSTLSTLSTIRLRRFLSSILLLLLFHSPELVNSQLSDRNPPTFGSPDASYCGASNSCASVRGNAAATDLVYTKGVPAVLFMQFLYSNKTTQVSNTTNTTLGGDYVKTATFYPFVDDYSELVIPGSYGLLSAWSLTTTNIPKIQVALYFRGQLFRSGALAWTKFDGQLYYVPFRTIVITLNNGE